MSTICMVCIEKLNRIACLDLLVGRQLNFELFSFVEYERGSGEPLHRLNVDPLRTHPVPFSIAIDVGDVDFVPSRALGVIVVVTLDRCGSADVLSLSIDVGADDLNLNALFEVVPFSVWFVEDPRGPWAIN